MLLVQENTEQLKAIENREINLFAGGNLVYCVIKAASPPLSYIAENTMIKVKRQ